MYTTGLLIAGIALGSLIGYEAPELGAKLADYVDYIVLILVSLLFFELRMDKIKPDRADIRFLMIAWLANFIVIPIIGYLVSSLFLSGNPLLFTGLFIYFMAPCTDWMLGFTKIANGNVDLGAKLIPINMISQLLLYPFYLKIFANKSVVLQTSFMDTILYWFLIPFVAAVLVRFTLRRMFSKNWFERISYLVELSIPYTIFLMITVIFSVHIKTITSNVNMFLITLLSVFLFFMITYFLGETLSKLFKLKRPERVLLAMTTAARNAPLMLAVTIVSFPENPLLYAAIIIGMLVEFPHLLLLTRLMSNGRGRE